MPPKSPALPSAALNPPAPRRSRIDWDDPNLIAFERGGRQPFPSNRSEEGQSIPEGSEADRNTFDGTASNRSAANQTTEPRPALHQTKKNQDASNQDIERQDIPGQDNPNPEISGQTTPYWSDAHSPDMDKSEQKCLTSRRPEPDHAGSNNSGNLHIEADRARKTGLSRKASQSIASGQTEPFDGRHSDERNEASAAHDAPNEGALRKDTLKQDASRQDTTKQTVFNRVETRQTIPNHSVSSKTDPYQDLPRGFSAPDDKLDELLDAWRSGGGGRRRTREPAQTVATNLKLTPALWEVVDRLTDMKGIKKNRYVVNLLQAKLPVVLEQLAGGTLDLPPVPGQGRERRGISLALPLEVADQLNKIIRETGIVQHELLLRLVVPRIIQDWEEARRKGGR